MALSKQEVSDILHDEAVIGQHYLVCGTEVCEKNCQFYCNPCHRQLCEQCRDEHEKNPDTKNHEVVPYRQRERQLPVEKCKDHPTKDLNILCEDCQVPLCYKCALRDHRKHELVDLETIYSERFTLYLDEIYKINRYFLPTSENMQKDIEDDGKEIKAIMNNIKESMKSEAVTLKNLVDTVISKNIEQVNKIEASIMENLRSQENTYKDYISYLEDLIKKFHGYLSSTKVQNNPIIFSLSEHLNIKPIPETDNFVPPIFTTGEYCQENVTKLLGKISIPNTKPGNRKFKPMETTTTQLKPTAKQNEQDREKSGVKQILSLASSVTKVREYTVPGVDNVHHMSLGKSGKLWVSDWSGNLIQTDLEGNQLQKIQTNGRHEGYHTVTQDRDLIYTDKKNKLIAKIALDNTVTEIIKIEDWEPLSIHSSHINGDILVGMRKDGKAKVTRYNKEGKEVQNIEMDNKGQEVFRYPYYITENVNGDICTSDLYKQAVVVVNKSGQHRFSYTGQGLEFLPCGICTDLLGHIIVCDGYFESNIIDILDKDGQVLPLHLTEQQVCPRGVCVDEENNIHVGQYDANTVTVYKYLQ